MSNETILANLKEAIRVIESTPDENLVLRQFKNACGTNACVAGWLASTKYFQDLGIKLFKVECAYQPFRLGSPTHPDDEFAGSGYFDYLNDILGDDAFNRLFNEAWDGDWDDEFYEESGKLTDKELSLLRLNRQLEIYQELK